MEKDRILQDSGLEEKWLDAARAMITLGWELDDQAEHYSQEITDSVIAGEVSVEELRGGVVWANALDKEVVDNVASVELLKTDDLVEALARRIAHHSGRMALKQVGSKHRWFMTAMNRHNITSFPFN